MSSFHIVAFLFGITAATPMANGFVPSSGPDTKAGVHDRKCRWWVGPNAETKPQASPFWADVKNSDENAPLHQACGLTSPASVVKMLLERGADPNVQNKMGRTPLFLASRRMSGEATVKLLLEHGANPAIADNHGDTPLHESLFCESMVKLLLEHGADPTVANNDGLTPLQQAIEFAIKYGKDSSIVELLLSHKDGARHL